MSPALRNLMSALETHLSRVVVPILQDYPIKGLDQTGTGTLLEHGDRLYLLTARHTFDGVPAEQIKVPDNPYGPGLVALWPFEIIESEDDVDDVIVLKLNKDCTKRLRSAWTTIPLAQCADMDLDEDHALAVAGYPSKAGVRDGNMIGGTFVVSYTDIMVEAPVGAEGPLRPTFDMFLRYEATGTRSDDIVMASPRMGGVSGAAIWDIKLPDVDSMWAPSTCLRLVGVQTDTKHFEYLRGLNWRIIRERLLPKF